MDTYNENMYKKALQKIKNDKDCKLNCMNNIGFYQNLVGPTGSTVPQGPTTIMIGSTTTIDAGNPASVINSGTETNSVLEFAIPAGATGPTGATGLAAYGGRFNNTSQTLTLGIGTQTQIPLANTMPNLNTTYATANAITVTQAGTYEINYYSNVSAAVATTLTLAVRANGTSIPATIISRALSVGVGSLYSGNVIVTLPAVSVIDMVASSSLALGVTLGSGVKATLSIKRLS